MAKGYVLSESDLAVLKRMVEWYRRTSGVEGSRDEDLPPSQAPESYVAKTPTDGIPARSGTTPGSVRCDLYRLTRTDTGTAGDYELTDMHATRLVLNLRAAVVEDEYVPITRLKGGQWVVVSGGGEEEDTGTGTGTDCVSELDGVVLDDLPTETSPSYALTIDSLGCLAKTAIGSCDDTGTA